MIIGNLTIIRPLEGGDEELLYRWWNDGGLMEHAGLAFGTLQSKEAIKNIVNREIAKEELSPKNKRFIICKKDSLTPIGEINYCSLDLKNQKCEFGIKICEINEQGKGYGKDALFHFIDFIFKNFNINKIELTTMIDNRKAQGLYKKLGFKPIGIIREAFYDSKSEGFQDALYMDILKREWKDKYKNFNDN
ncbi:GNAT family N-acetyltransferase [Clostridium senegalense]|uniref:GNAT family N-acetyltransferase n=1 Tax=Clostridium senegalense TaxID=1465809 RepID=UPI00028848E9|nr:GNAT family protein [Clostridium senegalense]